MQRTSQYVYIFLMVVIECVEENVAVYWGVKQQDLAWFTNAWRQWFPSEVEVFTVVGDTCGLVGWHHIVWWVVTVVSKGHTATIFSPWMWGQYFLTKCGYSPTTLHDVIIQNTTVRTASCACICYLIHMCVLFLYYGPAKPWHNTTVTAVCGSISDSSNLCVTGLHGHQVNMVYFECISKKSCKWSSPFIHLNLFTDMICVTFLL